jgi:hypothetical protein
MTRVPCRNVLLKYIYLHGFHNSSRNRGGYNLLGALLQSALLKCSVLFSLNMFPSGELALGAHELAC